MGGMLGLEVSLQNLPGTASRDDFMLYSESQGRVLVTVAPGSKEQFEAIMNGSTFSQIGQVVDDVFFVIKGMSGGEVVNTIIPSLLKSYKATLGDY